MKITRILGIVLTVMVVLTGDLYAWYQGTYNTFGGTNAGGHTTSDQNTFIGYDAGKNNTSGN